MQGVHGGTELTQTWEFLPGGIAFYHQRYPDDLDAQVALRIAVPPRNLRDSCRDQVDPRGVLTLLQKATSSTSTPKAV